MSDESPRVGCSSSSSDHDVRRRRRLGYPHWRSENGLAQALPIAGISAEQTRKELVDPVVANGVAEREFLKGEQPFGEQVCGAKLRKKSMPDQLRVVHGVRVAIVRKF